MAARYNPDVHHRRSIRLPGYDYSRDGAYFVTICVRGRECILGEMIQGQVDLSVCGHVVAQCWEWLAQRYMDVELDEWVIMPNHLHGIVVISEATCRGGSGTAPPPARHDNGRFDNQYGGASRWQSGTGSAPTA